MNGAMQISWKASVPGREAKGLDVFGAALERFEGLLKQGRISSHEEYFAVTGGDGGFMLIRGELEDLVHISIEPETLALNAKAAAIVQDFEIQVYAGGSDKAVQDLMGNYVASLQSIGYF